MATLEDVARGAIASVASQATWPLVEQWSQARYRQICRRVRMRHLRHNGELYIPGEVTAGTISVTQGSATATGDATAIAAWTPGILGRHLRVQTNWYRIISVHVASGVLTLSAPYADNTGTALSYKIVQRFTPLPIGTRHVGSFTDQRRRLPIPMRSPEHLDMISPERLHVGPFPRICVEADQGIDEHNRRVRYLEFYPYPTTPAIIHYLYWTDPESLQSDSELPIGLDEDILREGVLIDVMRYEMAQLVKAGNIEGAALMRNDYRAQQTTYERYIMEAIREDRAVEDGTMYLETSEVSNQGFSITSAHDQVLANWPR